MSRCGARACAVSSVTSRRSDESDSSSTTLDPSRGKSPSGASAERLFQALTNPEQRAAKWCGPQGAIRDEGNRYPIYSRSADAGRCAATAWAGKPFNIVGEYRVVERPARVGVRPGLPDRDDQATETLVRFDLDEHIAPSIDGAPHASRLQDRRLARPAPGVATNSVLVARLRRKLKGHCGGGDHPALRRRGPCA